MRSPSMLPTHLRQDSQPLNEFRRLWGSRRARLVSFAFAAVCCILILSATSGRRLRPFPSADWPSAHDPDIAEIERPPGPPPAAPPTQHVPPSDPKLAPATIISDPPPFPTLPVPPVPSDPNLWRQRAEQVKGAFVRSYGVYEQTAFPHDELRPVSGGTKDNLNGWGASLVDSLDTMIIMGLNDITNRSKRHVAQLTFDKDQNVQFFETVIRYLGGLLSAYALTLEPLFLTRADDLGAVLLPVFNTHVGLPSFSVNTKTGARGSGWMGNVAILSEMASCQMEYRYLAHLTGRPEYVKHVDFVTEFLRQHAEQGGLFPLTYNLDNSQPGGSTYSVGAQADSAYEYLLKQWLMTGRTEPKFLDMYLRSVDAIISHLLYVSPRRKMLYATDVQRSTLQPSGDMQHLSCFLAGLLALGAATIPHVDPRHAWAAEGLAHTCWITYADTATGLGPDIVDFRGSAVGTRWVDELAAWERQGRHGAPPGTNQTTPVRPGENTEYTVRDKRYLLRPETIESFYYMYRTTGDSKWRDRGWALFDAIERHSQINGAYASILDVNVVPAPHDDDMPSFFFAETLKYAYLLFSDDDKVPLDKWTFNTEAHPLPTFTWSAWETAHLGIN